MARSNKKFLPLYTNDMIYYYNHLIFNIKKNSKLLNSRYKTINYWNMSNYFKIHQGKTSLRLSVNEYFFGLKLGMFAKTRKPFFFRSKKKR